MKQQTGAEAKSNHRTMALVKCAGVVNRIEIEIGGCIIMPKPFDTTIRCVSELWSRSEMWYTRLKLSMNSTMAPLHHIINLLNKRLVIPANGVISRVGQCCGDYYDHEHVKSRWIASTIIIQPEFHHTNTRRAVVITTGRVDGSTFPVSNITVTRAEFKTG